MASTGVNVRLHKFLSRCFSQSALTHLQQVLRWSALFAGVAYGVYHQSSLRSQAKVNEATRKYHHQENLIAKAKAEYLKKTMPKDKLAAGEEGTLCSLFRATTSDPESGY